MTGQLPGGDPSRPLSLEEVHGLTGTGGDLVLRREDAVVWLVLSRPEKRNALTAEMTWGMGRVLRLLSEDATVRACVITGEGTAFCAGGEVGTFPVAGQTGGEATAAPAPPPAERSTAAYRPARGEIYPATAIRDCPFPVIAAVNGPAAGAGFALALACDLAVADPEARFGALQVTRGLVADFGLTWLLVDRVGVHRSLELLWSGDWVDARRALELGLVNRLSEPGEAREAAGAWATQLAAGPTVALSLMKRQAYRALQTSLEQAIELDSLMQARVFTTPDAAEGARAYREKRAPVFGG
jgi:2-(1,2-epoxy-1,2-dihydrophenyl)acetyl-CoA isomerase